MNPESNPQTWPKLNLPWLLGRALLFGGLILVTLGILRPWFGVPEVADDGTVQTADALITVIFRSVGFAALIFIAVSLWARRIQRAVISASAAATFLFFYPTALNRLAPGPMARAHWLQTQHENLTWLGGDLFTSQSSILEGNYTALEMVDTARGTNMLVIPKSLPGLLQFSRLADLTAWLGYDAAFCQFARVGWYAAVGGMFCIILGLLRHGGQLNLPLLRTGVKAVVVTGPAMLAMALVPVALAGLQVGRAHQALTTGDYSKARVKLAAAAYWLPLIEADTFYVVQLGLIDYRLGAATPEAELFRCLNLEEAGLLHQAAQGFSDLIARPGLPANLSRECRRGLLRASVSAFNSGRNEVAIEYLKQVLAVDPVDIKALLTLHRALVRAHNWPAAEEVAQRYRDTYSRFIHVTKKPARAAVDLPAALQMQARAGSGGTLP